MDYNFVSIEEFFSLEESGALLESGKFKGARKQAHSCLCWGEGVLTQFSKRSLVFFKALSYLFHSTAAVVQVEVNLKSSVYTIFGSSLSVSALDTTSKPFL